MGKLRNAIDKNEVCIEYLEKKLSLLQSKYDALAKRVHENEVYSEIGMPHLKDRGKLKLLRIAKEKGYFDETKFFTPIDYGYASPPYFKHYYSPDASNYSYDEKKDILRIPAIGIRGTWDQTNIAIYSNGHWTEVLEGDEEVDMLRILIS